ncbi:L,D-transpeptidase [Streptomyces sp. NPDC058284]|uniref:L,D-transpeptidase n=1 Tax=unclassified Streptomyces TaxID=2593676 RepID=UPI0036524889
MHHHGYLWTGSKQRFDDEALRRPPHPDPPPADKPELIQRYKEVKAEFPIVGLPPLETAYWLIKPRKRVRGTWEEPKEAAQWLGEQLTEYAPRFDSEADRDSTRLAILVHSAAERLGWGGDVSHGCYLERPSFLSLALVCCSPNRAVPELPCPTR